MNVLAGSLLKSSVFHSGVAGGLAAIEGILRDLGASNGSGVRGDNGVFAI